MELLIHGIAKCSLGKHALYSMLDDALGMLLQHLAESCFLYSAHIVGMSEICLLIKLLSRNLYLGRIDDDHVIAHVQKRCKAGFVLAAQNACNYR